MTRSLNCVAGCLVVVLCMTATTTVRADPPRTSSAYLEIVRAYADALIAHGRDEYGNTHSPLFAVALDRHTLRLLEGDALGAVRAIERSEWGIRPHDRILSGANPMHDENLYQVLHTLTAVTGDDRYAQKADEALEWFFEHCQSETTGLMAWGEHIGWDFRTETLPDKKARVTHEFFRPWILWDRTFALAPGPAAAFAQGLWEHQIGDQESGNFSRHARYDDHAPGTNSEYPRHGGFYIATWAHAYERTRDPLFLKAIETLLAYFEGRRNPSSGAIPSESAERSKGTILWPPSNLSLAIDLSLSASKLPEEMAGKLRASASRIDDVFLRLPHDLAPAGKGFVKLADTATLGRGDGETEGVASYTQMWVTGYGDATDAQIANLCILRYDQVKETGYRALIVSAADRYLTAQPDVEFPVYPGTFGDVIYLLVGAHTITGDDRYLERSHHFADTAIDLFLNDGSPLPKASNHNDHYEAITRADTLMMGLLSLWCIENQPGTRPQLVYSDR